LPRLKAFPKGCVQKLLQAIILNFATAWHIVGTKQRITKKLEKLLHIPGNLETSHMYRTVNMLRKDLRRP